MKGSGIYSSFPIDTNEHIDGNDDELGVVDVETRSADNSVLVAKRRYEDSNLFLGAEADEEMQFLGSGSSVDASNDRSVSKVTSAATSKPQFGRSMNQLLNSREIRYGKVAFEEDSGVDLFSTEDEEEQAESSHSGTEDGSGGSSSGSTGTTKSTSISTTTRSLCTVQNDTRRAKMAAASTPQFGRSIMNPRRKLLSKTVDTGKVNMKITEEKDSDTDSAQLNEVDMGPFQHLEYTKEGDLDAYYDLLGITMENTGRWAFGVNAIEVWVFDPESNKLVAADGSWWRDKVNEYDVDQQLQDVLTQLEDELSPNFIEAAPLVPGTGSAGILWQEEYGNVGIGSTSWRDLKHLANDPDQQPNERLNALGKAFGLAKGFYFYNSNSDTQGIVMFYARYSCDLDKLSSTTNTKYLRSSADLLGSMVSWKVPRLYAIHNRRNDLNEIKRRIRLLFKALVHTGWIKHFNIPQPQSKDEHKPLNYSFSSLRSSVSIKDVSSSVYQKVTTTVSKFKGGQSKIPQTQVSFSGAAWAFLGSFLALLLSSSLNELIKTHTSHDVTLAALGGLATAIFGLTSAPASQPRNALYGISIAGIMGVCSVYIPTSILPAWVRVPFVTSLAIATTLKVGLPHPPGAIAVIFSAQSEANWIGLFFLLLGYTVVILVAVVFINARENKIYPVYWFERPRICCQKDKELEE